MAQGEAAHGAPTFGKQDQCQRRGKLEQFGKVAERCSERVNLARHQRHLTSCSNAARGEVEKVRKCDPGQQYDEGTG